MPWRYDTTSYIGGNEIQFSDAEIVNIVGMGGMPHNGRVFASKYTPRESLSPAVIPLKEKFILVPPLQAGASVSTTLVMMTSPTMTKVIPDKVVEF